jgi:transcription elongation factor GreA
MQVPYRKPGKYSLIPKDPSMTQEKLLELQKKLDRLRAIQPAAAKEVSRLAELGDFSENVEYQLAKGRLRGINQGILDLEKQINTADIIEAPRQNIRIEVGHSVTVEIKGKQKTFQILGSSESKPEQGIISQNSPIGSALLGHRVGETIRVSIGEREIEYKILEIF